MLYVGIVNSVDGQPARRSFARQVIWHDGLGQLLEVHPQTGQTLPMSETAREAIAQGVGGPMVTDLPFAQSGHP
jgi:hypothetical protein